jgi:hypothetical protein
MVAAHKTLPQDASVADSTVAAIRDVRQALQEMRLAITRDASGTRHISGKPVSRQGRSTFPASEQRTLTNAMLRNTLVCPLSGVFPVYQCGHKYHFACK